MKTFRIGVVGTGFIGALHMDALRRIPGIEIAAVCETDKNLLPIVKHKFGVNQGFTDWRELVTNPEIDVIHNCTPNHLHDEVNRAAILAGKHIYSEKPLSLTAAGAKELWLLAAEHKIAHAVNHQYRLTAAVQEMKDRIQRNAYGRPLFVRGYYFQESQSRKTDYSKRLVPETSPARALADIGSHLTDIISCIMEQPVVSVMADMHTHHPVRIDPVSKTEVPIHSDDTTAVLFRLRDGTPGMMMVSKVACGHKNDLTVTVDAEEGEITWKQQQPDRLYIGRRDEGNSEIFMNFRQVSDLAKPYTTLPAGHVMGWTDSLRNHIKAFYESIWNGSYLEGNQPYATFEDGWHTNLFIDACIKSSSDRTWVDIKY